MTFRPNDFRPNDFRPNDFRPNDFRPNDFRPNDFRLNDFRPNDAVSTKFMSRLLISPPPPSLSGQYYKQFYSPAGGWA
jgi:hypothetical protein